MSDFEKNRAEYVVHLENQVKHLQTQLAAIQGEARWIPRFGTELDAATQSARITMAFGGKHQTARVSYTTLDENGASDITTTMLDSAFKDLVFGRLREVLEPEVAHAKQATKAIEKAGKW